jgi:hypothetical protein
MPTANTSYAEKTRVAGARALAAFHRNNPDSREKGANILDESARLERQYGQKKFVVRPIEGPAFTTVDCCPPACVPPAAPQNLSFTYNSFPGPFYLYDLSWSPSADATSYEVTTDSNTATVTITGPTSATVLWDFNSLNIIVTVTAVNSCGTASSQISQSACFLAGTPVHMADGTIKAIETIEEGDVVVGAFGEANPVIGAQTVVLGGGVLYKINGEHVTTDHHPHVSPSRKFYTFDVTEMEKNVYGMIYAVKRMNSTMPMKLVGLEKGRLTKLEIGTVLKTIDGERAVATAEKITMAPETKLYNLVVGGSHTYHADGYAVTGWPREDDFDYDKWVGVSV